MTQNLLLAVFINLFTYKS